ncbi:MAG: hypothetical protein ACXWUG_27375 [Polyangiales bacterium]
MDLAKMLDKCRREQWRIDDLEWGGKPREMSRSDEIAIVQYFTDMAQIERLAGALFREQERKVDDPTLKKIFRTFVVDEERHAQSAERLAKFYDVHHYQKYETNPHLAAFFPRFLETIRYMPPDIANVYITAGELILDVALLRSINDHVSDDMSQRAMDLINRDESRHIAIDYHMVEYYASPEYEKELENQPKLPVAERLRSTASFAQMLWFAGPFIRDVFFRPMEIVDPSGKRMREAFKRIQLLGAKPNVRKRPFSKVMLGLQDLYRIGPIRAVLGPVLERAVGVQGSVLVRLTTDSEEARARAMSFDDLAQEALNAKLERDRSN